MDYLSSHTPFEVKYAEISASDLGANEIVAAVTGKRIVLLSYVLSAHDAVTAKWQSGTTDLSGNGLNLIEADGAVAGLNPAGWLQTAAGAALNLDLSAAVTVGGHISYVEV